MKHLTFALVALCCGTAAVAADVVRYPLGGGSTFPIARAVEVPAGYSLVFHSGLTPAPADEKAEKFSAAYWGDTKTQTLSVFARMKESLDNLGLGFGDVVAMTALAVSLGVAFLTGTLVLNDTMRNTFDKLFASVYAGTDAVVREKAAFEGPNNTGKQRGRIDATVLDQVADRIVAPSISHTRTSPRVAWCHSTSARASPS